MTHHQIDETCGGGQVEGRICARCSRMSIPTSASKLDCGVPVSTELTRWTKTCRNMTRYCARSAFHPIIPAPSSVVVILSDTDRALAQGLHIVSCRLRAITLEYNFGEPIAAELLTCRRPLTSAPCRAIQTNIARAVPCQQRLARN